MAIRSREEAVSYLSGRQSVLVSHIHSAFDEFYDHCGSFAFKLEGWTKAGIIRDLWLDHISRFAEIDEGLSIQRKGNATALRVEDGFLVRPKKLDKKLRAKIAKTRSSKNFDRNKTQGSFEFGDAPLTTGYLGYLPNDSDLKRPTVYLVVNDENGRHAWEPIELVDIMAATAPAAQPQIENLDEQPKTSRARVKSGKSENRKKHG
jgi:hypothetical protein